MSALRTGSKLLLSAAAAALLVLLLRHWMATKQYVFNKEDISKLAKQYAGGSGPVPSGPGAWRGVLAWKPTERPSLFVFSGQDHEQAFSKVVVELRKR